MNLLEQMAAHLELCGFGTTASTENTGGNIHWAVMPDAPDECICIFSSDTGVPGSTNGARLQIMCRAKTARTAYETAVAIGQELDGYSGFLGGDGSMATIDVLNSGVGSGADTKKREMYATNIRVKYCM